MQEPYTDNIALDIQRSFTNFMLPLSLALPKKTFYGNLRMSELFLFLSLILHSLIVVIQTYSEFVNIFFASSLSAFFFLPLPFSFCQHLHLMRY